MQLSKRSFKVDPSAIQRVFALAGQLENPCNLSVGQPHFETPAGVCDAAISAIRDGKNAYTPAQGIAPLCEAILKRYAARGIPQEAVMSTSAVSGAFLLALLAMCDEGDEILIPDPAFFAWYDLAKVFGVKPVFVDTYPDFKFTREALEKAVSPRTKALIFCSPSNPTGAVTSKEELELIADFAKAHNIWVIYDEIYEVFNYDAPQLDMCRYYNGTITLNGWSKSHSMTGWRIGTAVGPKVIIDQMIRLQQYLFVCPSSIAQWGALAALETQVLGEADYYRQKRDFMVEKLSRDYELVPPGGAFYLFPKVPKGMTGEQFVMKALDQNLIILPGSIFSSRDTHFRISYANTHAELERGVEILLRLARG